MIFQIVLVESLMMKKLSYHVLPSGPLEGELIVPGDKSISHRAAILGALAEGATVVKGFLACRRHTRYVKSSSETWH